MKPCFVVRKSEAAMAMELRRDLLSNGNDGGAKAKETTDDDELWREGGSQSQPCQTEPALALGRSRNGC